MKSPQALIRQLSLIGDLFPAPLYLTELDTGNFLYVNPAFYELFEHTKQSLKGISASILYAGKKRELWARQVRTAKPGDIIVDVTTFRTRTRRRIPVVDIARMLTAGDSKLVLGLLVDTIAESLMLAKSRVKAYQEILDLNWVNVGVHTLEAPERRIVWMNSSEKQLLEVSKAWFGGKPQAEVLSPARLRNEVIARVDDKFEGGDLTTGEHRIFVTQGQSRTSKSPGTLPVNIHDFAVPDPRSRFAAREIITAVRDVRMPLDIQEMLVQFGPCHPLLEKVGVYTFVKVRRRLARRVNPRIPKAISDKGNKDDLIFTFGNAEFQNELRTLGRISASEDFGLSGKTDDELFPETAATYVDVDLEVLRNGKPDQRIEEHPFRSHFARVLKVPLKLGSHKGGIGIEGFYWDLARDEAVLGDLRDIYRPRNILDDLAVPVYRKDDKLRFTYANDAYCKDIGRPLREIIGMKDDQLFPEKLAAKYERDDKELLSGRVGTTKIWREEHYTKGKRRTGREVEVRKTRIVGGIQGVFWFVDEAERQPDSVWIDWRSLKVMEGNDELLAARSGQRHLLLMFEQLLRADGETVPYHQLDEAASKAPIRMSDDKRPAAKVSPAEKDKAHHDKKRLAQLVTDNAKLNSRFEIKPTPGEGYSLQRKDRK